MVSFMAARLARIHMAKNASGNAFLSSKKKIEELILAQESGLEMEDLKGGEVFELQHHHLLTCLEKTTEREFTEMDMTQSGHGAPNKITSTPPLTPVPSIQSLDQRRTGCCARRPNTKKYQILLPGYRLARSSLHMPYWWRVVPLLRIKK
ncbi:hypothetical protein LSH36_412g01023 [Paralvinella palmiformis]|uniref:Potassium channel voltage dependent Kv4 C-terminal domain-containing protein n=1 Tax=Paralvinella palmiformis TaxID=53620 RepID=A0AAD9JCL8_9ANNE|nr:hypothetical protein LSH36_412g01023 [Paralvinella palmiformis]